PGRPAVGLIAATRNAAPLERAINCPRVLVIRGRRGSEMKLRSANSSDLAAVEQLLEASDLPIVGVRDNFDNFVVAEEDGTIAGAVGLEKYGAFGLLRSAVVSPRYRSAGVGRQLVERLLARAEEA